MLYVDGKQKLIALMNFDINSFRYQFGECFLMSDDDVTGTILKLANFYYPYLLKNLRILIY